MLLVIVVAACGGSKVDPTTASAGFRQLPADQVIAGFEQYISQAGAKQAILKGDTAYLYEDSAMAKVQNVHLTIFDEKGQVSANLTSKTGDVNNATQAMVARGNVVLITTDGRRIETEELHYDPNAHRIFSNVPTVQRYQGGVLRGTGFDADDKFNNVLIRNARSSGGGIRIQF